MPKTIPVVISNDCVLVKDRDTEEFKEFTLANFEHIPNIPFYHQYAKKIAVTQDLFKQFVKSVYEKKLSKFVIALIVPDDTSKLESIFINEFFLHSEACKAVAQTTMSQVISKEPHFITVSKSCRNVVLQYIKDGQIAAQRMYDINSYDPEQVMSDARRIHIDIEYETTPVYVNDFNKNMDDFYTMGHVITTRGFLDKVSAIDVEKV